MPFASRLRHFSSVGIADTAGLSQMDRHLPRCSFKETSQEARQRGQNTVHLLSKSLSSDVLSLHPPPVPAAEFLLRSANSLARVLLNPSTSCIKLPNSSPVSLLKIWRAFSAERLTTNWRSEVTFGSRWSDAICEFDCTRERHHVAFKSGNIFEFSLGIYLQRKNAILIG
jgi:hypothetical protein